MLRTHRFLDCRILCLVLLVASTNVRAQETPAVVPSDPRFEAVQTDGARLSGRVAALTLSPDGRGSITLVGDSTKAIPLDRIVKVSRADTPTAPSVPAGGLIVFPEGDQLRALVNSSANDALEIQAGVLGDRPTRVPLDTVLGIALLPTPSSAPRDTFATRFRDAGRKGDMLWLTNGDTRAGTFVGIDAEQVKFDAGAGETTTRRDSIDGVGFDPALVKYPPPKAPFLELGFVDGSRLGVTECRLERGQLSARTRFNASITVPWNRVARLVVLGGSVAYLGQRATAATQFVPYLDRHPSNIGVDSTWDGLPIRLAGQPVERGLGMLPRTLAAYRVEPGDLRFQTTVGLDDRCGELASVEFRVLVDRKEVFVSPSLTRNDKPIDIDIDLGAGKLLVLIAEFGDRGDVQDSAVWAEARLIRSAASSSSTGH